VPILMSIPSAVHFVSAEPLLGRIDFERQYSCQYPDWVIIGGESGPRARYMDLGWVEELLGQCDSLGIKLFVKQLGGHPDKRNRMEEWPKDLQVREFPKWRTYEIKFKDKQLS